MPGLQKNYLVCPGVTWNSKVCGRRPGDVPEGWRSNPAKLSQKDTDARWAKQNNVPHYGYKNHADTDRRFKLIRRCDVTNAAVHDSRRLEAVLDPADSGADLRADSA